MLPWLIIAFETPCLLFLIAVVWHLWQDSYTRKRRLLQRVLNAPKPNPQPSLIPITQDTEAQEWHLNLARQMHETGPEVDPDEAIRERDHQQMMAMAAQEMPELFGDNL